MVTKHGCLDVGAGLKKAGAAERAALRMAEEKAAHLATHALDGETLTVTRVEVEGALAAFAVTLAGEGFTHEVTFVAAARTALATT